MSSTKTIDILPKVPQYYELGLDNRLDLKAICLFVATGFFLDNSTFFLNRKTYRPGFKYQFDKKGKLVSEERWFQWSYQPVIHDLGQAVEEYAEVLHRVTHEFALQKQVILPLSGGLDSRTLAAALLQDKASVRAYSYEFEDGLHEASYGKLIAQACKFDFQEWKVEYGVLWKYIDQLARLNGCYSEFTHPRQMAFVDRFSTLGDVFALGHWGDVLFDDMGIADDATFDQQVTHTTMRIVKKGGEELARKLWEAWGLSGSFTDYLTQQVTELLSDVGIENSANARIRAFKSTHWAPRWTSTNLSVFHATRPVALPYYDERMCRFVCTVSESLLSGRRIQIAYLKKFAPELARISWQAHHPFSLFTYQFDRSPINLPFRLASKARRVFKPGRLIQRNWELQFLGDLNQRELMTRLFDSGFNRWIPADVVQAIWDGFYTRSQVQYSHPLSMLLTLSMFSRLHRT